MAGAPSWPLVGRAEELDLLAETVTGDAGSFVVAGPAGVGKSRLAAALLAQAAAGGSTTRSVRATRSTATIPFGAFAPWIAADDGVTVGDRLQLLRIVTANLADGHEHVLIAVDDAHLLDDGSAALVLHLVADPRVSIVATVRSGEACPDAVTALWKENLAERVDLQPLSKDETAALLQAVLGGELEPATHERLWSLTRGLPLYLREVVRAGLDQGVLVEADGAWRWDGALACSDRLLALIDDRLANADDDERRLVELVASGEPLPLPILAELGLRPSLAGVERLGILEVDDAGSTEPGAAPRAGFAHPLYGEVVRGRVPAARARDHRSALVRAALAVGWQQRDPILVAGWALESDVRLPVADAVAAARRALALSEWSLAERLSVAASSDGDERGAEAVLTHAIALAPQVRWDAGMAALASTALASLGDRVDLQVVGEAARIHAWVLFYTPGEAVPVADVLVSTDALPAAVRPTALAHCAFQAILTGRPDDATSLAGAAITARPQTDDGPGLSGVDDVSVQAQSVMALARGFQGRTAEALEHARAGLPHVAGILAGDPVPGNPAGAMPVAFCAALVLDGRVTEAAAVASMIHDGTADGARALRALAGSLAARMELFAGRLDAARRLAADALAICRETGQLPASHWPAAILASAAAQAGDVSTGEEVLAEAAAACPEPPLYGFEARLARGWLHAADGRTSAAQAEAVATAEAATERGLHAFVVHALLDLARFGAPADASERLASMPATVTGAYVDVVRAHADALARGDAVASADVSTRFEEMGALLLAAEASAAAASAHAAAGRQGSEATALGRARVLAAACGNPVTPALRTLDGDAALASLTAREREVVELAARGLTNREIGERLFVSVRTVNTHLYRSYAKLGVNDRSQLAAWLLADP